MTNSLPSENELVTLRRTGELMLAILISLPLGEGFHRLFPQHERAGIMTCAAFFTMMFFMIGVVCASQGRSPEDQQEEFRVSGWIRWLSIPFGQLFVAILCLLS